MLLLFGFNPTMHVASFKGWFVNCVKSLKWFRRHVMTWQFRWWAFVYFGLIAEHMSRVGEIFTICLHCKSLSIEFFHYLIKHVGTQTMLLRLRLVPSSGPKRFIFWLPCQWKIIIPFRSLFWVELKKLNNILLLHLCRRYCDTQQDDKGSRCST